MIDIREYSIDELVAFLPLPADEVNKYTRGVLTTVVGSARYPGAACLSSFASQRMGAGYTEVITDPEVMPIVHGYRPSLVVRSWDNLAANDLPASSPDKPRAYLVGSGFDGADSNTERLTHFVLWHAEAPVIVDGSALGALTSKKGQSLLKRRFLQGLDTVVTPHAGEAANLARAFDLPAGDPATLSYLLSLAYGFITVVKGPDTYLSDGNFIVRVTNGTSALAKAGTGDVLAGMLAALLAQGLPSLESAVLATDLHARAGRVAAANLSAIAVTAEDVIDYIPHAIAQLTQAQEAPAHQACSAPL